MLSRRHLRIKVLQELYAFFQSENDKLELGEKQLLKSIDKLYDQYIYLLSFVTGIFEFAEKRIEEGKKKFLPKQEDLHPNTRFVNNRFYKQISSNKDFRKKEEKLKINWIDEEALIRKIFQEFREGKWYHQYMQNPTCNYNDDKSIVISLLKKEISDSEALEYFFEDKDIHWASDYYLAIWLVIKALKMYQEDWNELRPLPGIIKTEYEDGNEDKNFIIILFRKTILRNQEFEQMIEERAKNWELDRIATMDKLILKMAIAELTEFPSIPVKVTLNEYIELAKVFSTSKSRVFINGILDKLITDLQDDGRIVKTGRGLMT